jgi:hypothetical protein
MHSKLLIGPAPASEIIGAMKFAFLRGPMTYSRPPIAATP